MRVTHEDARLLEQAAAWDGPPPSATNIGGIAQEHGLDFATALLHEHLRCLPAHEEYLRAAAAGEFPLPDGVSVGIVPGAFHREHRHSGADGARVLAIARALGVPSEVIPTASFGTLAENAQTIRQWIADRRGSRIALVSLSKGGADVKHALSRAEWRDTFADVIAWVSLSGIVQGTPLIGWLQRRPLRWWAIKLALWWGGHARETLADLRHGAATPLARWCALPPHMRVVHVCGFPLQRHLAHPWAHRGYARLAPLGPNDGGGTLLADTLDYPGIVCPIWGADHYLSPPWDATPLLTAIVASALAPRHAIQSANQPSAPPASRSSA
jgi:hypothetical protein